MRTRRGWEARPSHRPRPSGPPHPPHGMQLAKNNNQRVKVKLNPKLRISGILPTIHKSRTLHSQEVLELVRERYGDVVFDVVIKDSIRFGETPLGGMSILHA